MIATLAIAPAALAACGGGGSDDSKGGGGGQAAGVGEPDGLLEWMASHPDKAGLVVAPENGAGRLELSGDRRFPLASTRKVLILGALTQSRDSLASRVPRSAVERWYAPGTDGGAHEDAELDEPLTLSKVARAVAEVSDNAAADALLHRVGPDAVDAYAERQGMANQDPMYHLLGEYAAWTRERKWTSLSPRGRARRAHELARSVPAKQVKAPAIDRQRRLAVASVAGAPSEWATLMGNVAREGDPQLIELLDGQRRRDPKLREAYTRLLSKGGSLPGVLTEAAYVQPRGRPGVAVALFLRDLPPDVEETLLETLSSHELLLRLGSDPAFRERAAEVLAK